jgi:hypothetical protein
LLILLSLIGLGLGFQVVAAVIVSPARIAMAQAVLSVIVLVVLLVGGELRGGLVGVASR